MTLLWWLPVNDWQFWAVTTLFIAALAWLFRSMIPSRRLRRRRQERKVNITVGGKSVK